MEMRKPSLEEVREHFKDAETVECASLIGGEFDITEFEQFDGSEHEWNAGKKDYNHLNINEYVTLWNYTKGYAEILTYKNKPMRKVIMFNREEEKEKELKPIELKKYLSTNSGWVEAHLNPDDFNEIRYLGKCNTDGDMFAVFHKNGNIFIYKGHLNDGVW